MELQAFLERLQRVTRSSDGWSARCPAHDDRDPSLSVGLKDNKILVKCHANPECSVERIVAAMGLTKADLFTDNAEPRLELQATYHYLDEFGVELFQKLRYRKPDGGKTFRIRHQENGAWVWNARGCRRVLYRLPELLGAINEGRTVFVVDGEKDADNLWKGGHAATCDPMGAGKWKAEYGDILARAPRVVVVADREEGGLEQATTVAFSLGERTAHEIVEAAAGKDISDHLRAGRTVEELVPVGGLADLLDRLELFIRRYVVISDEQACACALWVAHTWALDAFNTTAYLFFSSAEEESGKTRAMEVLEVLVENPMLAANISDAALYRAIEEKKPVVFLDEVDAIFSTARKRDGTKDSFKSLINAGYRRGSPVVRVGGSKNDKLEDFETFSAKVLAGIGHLPRTLASRCITIMMKRRARDEPVEDFFRDDVAAEAEGLKAELLTWRERSVRDLRALRPERVPDLRDRTQEVWRGLLAVAASASPHWNERARHAALELAAAGVEPSWGVQLLEDIRTVFGLWHVDRIPTAELVDWLRTVEESPWAEQFEKGAPRRLAKILKPYGIHPRTIRMEDGTTPKGYRLEDFKDAWRRLLPLSLNSRNSATDATSAQPSPNGGPPEETAFRIDPPQNPDLRSENRDAGWD